MIINNEQISYETHHLPLCTSENEPNVRICFDFIPGCSSEDKKEAELYAIGRLEREQRYKRIIMERIVRCFSDEAAPPRKIPNPTKVDAISRIDSLQSNQHGIAYVIPPYILGEFQENRPRGERLGMKPNFFPFEGKKHLRDALKISLEQDMDCVLCLETLRRSPQGK